MPRMEARSYSSFPRGFPIRREAIKEEMREEEEQGREMQGEELPAWEQNPMRNKRNQERDLSPGRAGRLGMG